MMLPPSVISGTARNGDQRVDAHVHRGAESFACGREELAPQLGCRGERHGVDQDIQLAVLLFERRKQAIDLRIDRNIALKTAGARQLGDQVLRFGLHPLVLVTNGQGCSGLVKFLGDAPGDRSLVGQPEDHGRFPCQIDHACFSSSVAHARRSQHQPINRISAGKRPSARFQGACDLDAISQGRRSS